MRKALMRIENTENMLAEGDDFKQQILAMPAERLSSANMEAVPNASTDILAEYGNLKQQKIALYAERYASSGQADWQAQCLNVSKELFEVAQTLEQQGYFTEAAQ